MTAPIRAAQIVYGDTYSVVVSLDPTPLIDVLARALSGHHILLTLAILPPDHPEQKQARAKLEELLADVLTVTITPAEAAALDLDLYEAMSPPAQCQWCDRYFVVVIDGQRHCDAHAKALDTSREATS